MMNLLRGVSNLQIVSNILHCNLNYVPVHKKLMAPEGPKFHAVEVLSMSITSVT